MFHLIDDMLRGINNTPFHKHQDHVQQMKEYALPVTKLIAMLLRNNNTLMFDLPSNVQQNMEDIRHQVNSHTIVELSVPVFYLLQGLWTHTWPRSPLISFPDPTVVCIALMMLQSDGSFANPKNTTPVIAKVEYDMRMVFIVEVHQRAQSGTDKEILKEGMQMERWYNEKHDSTFNSIRSLQHRASSIAYAQQGLPRIWWLDRRNFRIMLYEGHEINFSHVCAMFQEIEHKAIEIWETNILCGLDLHHNYDLLVDDLTNTEVGHSFLSDQNNPFIKDRDILLNAILAHPHLQNVFIAGSHPTSGQPIWNKFAFKAWLRDYSKLHGLMVLRANMLGGSPGRITELTAMCYKNTNTRTRNFLAFGKYIAMLVTYHKGSALTGEDKLIPHAFDAITSDLLVQDLGIARPFAELAVHICFPDNRDIRKIYQDNLFVNYDRLFVTTDVTNLMKHYSLQSTGYAIGSMAWRHISAGWRRKLCSSLGALIEDEDNETIAALQSSHSRKMENRMYGVSADTLSGAAEDVLPLYLEFSTHWQIECKTVPGGLGLSYKEARSLNFDNLVKAGVICSPQTTDGDIQIANQVASKVLQEITPTLESQAAHIITELRPLLTEMITEIVRNVIGMSLRL